jgi:hypothetical protein
MAMAPARAAAIAQQTDSASGSRKHVSKPARPMAATHASSSRSRNGTDGSRPAVSASGTKAHATAMTGRLAARETPSETFRRLESLAAGSRAKAGSGPEAAARSRWLMARTMSAIAPHSAAARRTTTWVTWESGICRPL